MKKRQITHLAVYDFGENKEVIDFDFEDWVIEAETKTQLEKDMNKIRATAKKIFQAKYKTHCQVHFTDKEL